MSDVLRAVWRLDAMRVAVDGLRQEFRAMSGAAQAAHTNMAKAYQRRLRRNLLQAIQDRGREQRHEQRLVHFLNSTRNREVDEAGWRVGFLDRDPLLRLYARGLETGTEVHRGRRVPGYFQEGGRSVAPNPFSGRRGLFIYSPGGVGQRRSRMVIERGIRGYRYFENTSREWIDKGKTLDAGFYKRAFGKAGLNYSLIWFNHVNATAGDVVFGGDE